LMSREKSGALGNVSGPDATESEEFSLFRRTNTLSGFL
jgi:hypothetical protein